MRLTRIVVVVLGTVAVASLGWQSIRLAAQTPLRIPEQIAVFSGCGQAPAAAKDVEAKVNTWFDDHRAVRVVQRELFTAPCPGAVEYGSVAITIAIHYQSS